MTGRGYPRVPYREGVLVEWWGAQPEHDHSKAAGFIFRGRKRADKGKSQAEVPSGVSKVVQGGNWT